jgi:hypothetical protein
MVEQLSPEQELELARFARGELDPRAFPHREHVRMAYEMLRALTGSPRHAPVAGRGATVFEMSSRGWTLHH